MNLRINREMKHFCPDFKPIREILRDLGAAFVEEREQVDYFFFLPDSPDKADSRRLKLRIENGKKQIIYYYDRNQPDSRFVDYQVAQVNDPLIKDVLEAALGVRTVVKKHREVWKKENTLFNLDRVHGVGAIFEVEVEQREGYDPEQQLAHYQDLFRPYLGPRISGSNEDLVST